MTIDWGLVGNVVFSGILIVFVTLILLILLVILLGKIMGQKPAPQAAKTESAPAPAPAASPAAPVVTAPSAGSDDTQTVAVISAAVAAYMADAAPGTPYQITGITPRTGRAKELRPVWGFAGMRQNTEPF